MGWWHHSMECTIDKVDFRWMQNHLRVYAAWLWDLCTAAILPFDFCVVAQQFATRLEEFGSKPCAAVLGLDEVAQRARALDASIMRLLTPAFGLSESAIRPATRIRKETHIDPQCLPEAPVEHPHPDPEHGERGVRATTLTATRRNSA